MTPTPAIIRGMADYISEFREHGGLVRMPPHGIDQRRAWMAAAKRHRESWDELPANRRTDELRRGLGFMWASVKRPRCIVALKGTELVAALCYDVQLGLIEAKVVGSRQMESARGAGTALEFALAEEAERRGMDVRGEYAWYARNFHVRIGRRLDIRGHQTSDWTAEDCRFLVRGIKELL